MAVRILIVDDNSLVLKALRCALGRYYEVLAVDDIDNGLTTASTSRPQVAIADLDLSDPNERDGFWLLEQLEQRWGIPGIVLTGRDVAHERHVIVRKPVSRARLCEVIDDVIKRSAPAPQA